MVAGMENWTRNSQLTSPGITSIDRPLLWVATPLLIRGRWRIAVPALVHIRRVAANFVEAEPEKTEHVVYACRRCAT